ncbi:MAG: peptidoglycan-binding protein [Pseudomonadota bacterium]
MSHAETAGIGSHVLLAQANPQGLSFEERQTVQLGLNALGINVGIADGVFGPATREGIRQFQRRVGQPATGVLTRDQYVRLAQQYQAVVLQNGGQIQRPLTASELRELQSGLRTLGWYGGAIDGVAGNKTMQAVNEFLRGQGLNPNSVTTENALDLIRQQVQQQSVASGNTAASGPSFSCDNAGTPTERAICGSEPLARLDRVLSDAYSVKFSKTPWAGREALKADQRAWLQVRNGCGGDADCLRTTMADRIEALAPSLYGQIVQLARQPDYLSARVQSPAGNAAADGVLQPVPVSDREDIAPLAAELGIPVKNGYLVSRHPQFFIAPEPNVVAPDQPPADANAWARLETLAYIGRDPQQFRESDAFVRTAALMLQGAEFSDFFPDRTLLEYALRIGGLDDWRAANRYPFQDEFVYADKKQEFFEKYYPRLLEKVPSWPIPIMHVIPMRLGEYDMERGAFPLSVVLANGQTALHVASFQSDDRRVATPIASADLIENIPQWLEMPVDQARLLRAEKPGEGYVYLGWYAELDWGADVNAPAVSVDPTVTLPHTPRGTAELRHVAIYKDAQVSSPIVTFDPATFGRPPDDSPVSAKSAILEDGSVDASRIRTATDNLVLRHAADLAPETYPDEFATMIAGQANEVRQSDQFDRPAVLAAMISKFKGIPKDEVWLESVVELGIYNQVNGWFDLTAETPNFWINNTRDSFNAKINVTFVDPVALPALEVPLELAKYLVRSNNNEVRVSVLVDIERAALMDGSTVAVFVRPRVLAYTYVDPETGTPVTLAAQTFDSADTQTPRETESFRGEEVPFSLATAALLYSSQLDSGPRLAFHNILLPIIWQSERDGFALPGRPFFPPNTPLPVGSMTAAFMDDFSGWADAKAEALQGARFLLSSDHRQYFAQDCRTGASALANTEYAQSATGRALGIDQVNAARQAAGNGPEPTVLERDVLVYTADPSRPGDLCKSSDWTLFADVTGVGAWSEFFTSDSGMVTLSREIISEFKGLEFVPGRAPMQDAIFRFDALETIFLASDESGNRGQEVRRVAAVGPAEAESGAQSAAQTAEPPAPRLYEPAHTNWTGTYQCSGATSARMNMDFEFPAPNTIQATINYAILAPNPEVGAFVVEGLIDPATETFDFNGGRWIFGAQGRASVPAFSGRFVGGGEALDLLMSGNACYAFDLRPGTSDLTAVAQPGTPSVGAEASEGAAPARLSDFDIVGLRTGMSLGEAQEIVLREFRVAAVFDASVQNTGDLKALSYTRVFIGDNADQTIILFAPDRNGPVTAIARHVNKRDGAFDIPDLSTRLVQKYGEAVHSDPATGALAWSHASACAPLPLRQLPQRYFSPVQGISSGGTLPPQNELQYAVSDIGVLLSGDAQDVLRQAECDVVLQFGTTSHVPRNGISVFNLFLIDLDAVRDLDGVPAADEDEIKL